MQEAYNKYLQYYILFCDLRARISNCLEGSSKLGHQDRVVVTQNKIQQKVSKIYSGLIYTLGWGEEK